VLFFPGRSSTMNNSGCLAASACNMRSTASRAFCFCRWEGTLIEAVHLHALG
jgi:hypothetical protein